MSRTVRLELSDRLYQVAQQLATATERSVEQVLVAALESWLPSTEDAITEAQTWPFTEKQGQYLAFIHYYTKIHSRPPAESDMQYFFQTTAPSVHQMVIRLEARGFISKVPGQARSIQVLVPPDKLPELE
jgi:DNA-binding MarR family transcriptional regulator